MWSSIGVALRTFSEDMRTKRMLLAEEKAMALSAKLTVPLIVFIFPTLMIMLLLPAGIRLAETLGLWLTAPKFLTTQPLRYYQLREVQAVYLTLWGL